MIKLTKALKAWGTPGFKSILKDEIKGLSPELLPLQQGLSQSSYVSDSDISVLIHNITETASNICAKTGIFYAGTIAGSCCADDPTVICEETEYCEVQFAINKITADTTIALLET